MVLINAQKFACQSCIKGHRSSSCEHEDRPLFEIRKKGRPVIQCETCRDLRRTKKLHVRCSCPGRKDPEADIGPVQIQSSSSATTSRKAGRKIPIVPRLPRGVKDYKENSPLSPQSPISTTQSAGTAITNDSQGSDDLILSHVTPTSPVLPASTARPVRPCCARKATTVPSSNDFAVELAPEVTMTCLCGPSCLCHGCTKHRPYGDADGIGDANGCAIGCPPDCPSCSNNEGGLVWPGSIQLPSSDKFPFRSSVEPQPSLSHASRYSGIPDPFFESIPGFDMDEDYDDELDAEGSPDPTYVALPDSSISETFKHSIPQKPTTMNSTISKLTQRNGRI